MTITRAEVRAALLAALKGVHRDVTVYAGTIPEAAPTYSGGVIRPYVGLWVTNSTDDPYARALSAMADTEAVRLRIQTQIVAASEPMVYDVADRVTDALTNLPVGTHWVLPDTDQQGATYLLTDTSVSPSRPYLPLVWTLNTQ